MNDCLSRTVEDCFGFLFFFPSLEANKLLGHSFMKQAEAPGSETKDLW